MSKIPLEAQKELEVHTDIDKVYEIVEGNGRYRFLVLIGATIPYLCHMFFLFAIPFLLIRPQAYCNLGGYWHECTREEVCENEGVAYRFDEPAEFNFVTEFGWYCDETTPSFFTATAFFLGTTFSVLIVSNLSDMLGRLPMLIFGILGNMFGVALLVVFAGPYMCFVGAFLIGFFTMANNSGSFNFLADSVQEKYRESLPTVMNMGWAAGEVVVALIMWAGATWRELFLFMFIFSATFFIPLFWLREAPKHYFVKGKIHQAQARLNTMARINGVDISHIKLAAPSKDKEAEGMSFGQRMKIMCCEFSVFKQIALVTVMFGVCNMIFYAISLNLENMGGNIYINGVFVATTEIIACLTSGLSLKCIGPKVALSGSFILTVIGVAGLGFFWDDPVWSIAFCVVGKLGSAAIDNLLYTLSGIFFPTAIMGGALGIALLGTRFGNILAKPIYLLGSELMCIIMVGLGVVAAILPIFLTTRSSEKKENEEGDATTEKI